MRMHFTLLVIILFSSLFIGCTNDKNNDDDDDDSDDDTSPICEPTCWENSTEQTTGSLDQIEQWADACMSAESGCPGRYCVATKMEFQHAPKKIKYAVQCESGFLDNTINSRYCTNYWGGGAIADRMWLGPEYGFLTSKNYYVCNPDPNDAWTVTGWARYGLGLAYPTWSAEKIQDALVHEISAMPCEEITDLRACIRAFIPPDIHCTPKFDKYTDLNFVSCESKQEPFNRPLGWREMYQD